MIFEYRSAVDIEVNEQHNAENQWFTPSIVEMSTDPSISSLYGEQAIEKFNDTYDLIFLDIGLPDISGFEVCKTIRSTRYGESVPIVALTAIGDIVKSECLAVGMNEVAIKPILIEGLEDILTTWIK